MQLNRIDEGQGVEAALIDNDARWHHICILNCNKTMLQRAEKSNEVTPINITNTELPPNEIDCGLLVQADFLVRHLIFCGQTASTDILHQASTYQIDHRVRESA